MIAVAVAGAVAGAGAGAVAVAGAGAVAAFVQRGLGVPAYVLQSTILALALVAATVALPANAPPVAKTALLFLGFFPLVNAWFDYVSYALTLTLVRWGLKAKGWAAALYGALDVVVAFVLFSLLGATLTAIAALLNRHVTADFYPLAPVFAGAARGDPQYFWLYGMIFSTFVPTFLHLSIASLSLISIVPQGWRLWLWDIYTIPADDWLRRAIGCAGIGLVATLAAGLPLAVAWGVISALLSHFHEIGTGYLTIFRWVATTLGEPI